MNMKGGFLVMFSIITLLVTIAPIPKCGSSRPSSSKLTFPKHLKVSTRDDEHKKSLTSLPLFHRTHPSIQKYFHAQAVAPFSRIPVDQALFYVHLFVGTPATPNVAVFDTGSVFTWLKESEDYDPFTASDSYQGVACGDSICKSVPNNNYCGDDSELDCAYDITYADGTDSQGDVGSDDFFLFEANQTTGTSLPDPSVTVPMIFGAGSDGTNTKSGVMGVSTHPLGLLTALEVDSFSVCFPNPRLPTLSNSTVRFGRNACVSGDSTPLDPTEIYKWVFTVETITVEASIYKHPTSTTPEIGGNFVFDTGAAVSWLSDGIMDVVVPLVKKYVKATPMSSCADGFELCYEGHDKPAYRNLNVSFQLKGGVSLYFEFGNIWRGIGGTYFAFAFKRSSIEKSIFGVQQMLGWNIGVVGGSHELFFDKIDC